ncbi:unnamed protein product [Allacma fusca]|uniref:Carboxylic ester hydrolase n=1 Tax=Allacma fusca TaxID=39272 RepID=A0A8J2LHB3_9HEXA|nr:unnamed protein product [Allacma fusca]
MADYFEDVPLVVTTASYERAQRKRYKRNVAISIGLVALAIVVIILVVSLSSNGNANQIPQVQKAVSLRLEASGDDSSGNNTKIRKSPIVRVKQGRLQGAILKSRKGRNYYSFFNIPYGKPPIKELRFENPEPAGRWKERIYDATKVKTWCVNGDKTKENAITGSEDCLHVHVSTVKLPSRRNKTLVPVMVYIYGGAFKSGYASRFQPHYFMDEDIVVVLIEFRSGVFGHLNTGDGVIGGNLSLKDQSLALKWVRDNIQAFGGNPNQVVLFGNSAGSISVHAHLLSEMSRGLFHGAISQSGVSLGPNMPDTFLNNPGSIARRFANVVRPGIAWGLTGETVPTNEDRSKMFFKDKPINLMRNGDLTKVPWIVGVNSAEEFYDAYELVQNKTAVAILNQNWTTLILEDKLGLLPDDDLVDDEIRQLYFNDSDKITREDRYGLTNLLSDRKYLHPCRTAGMLHSKHSPVYFYYFNKESNFSLHDDKKYDFPPPYGAGHGDDLQYLFNYDRYPEVTLTDERMEFSEDMIKIWVSFAYNLAPDPMGLEPWQPIQESQDGLIWYQMNDKPLRKNIEPFTARMKFWDRITEQMNLYG